MAHSPEDESGVRSASAATGDELDPRSLVRSCHDILDALSAIAVNVDWVAEAARRSGSDAEAESIAEDLRVSVARIENVARTLQAAARRRCAA